jgi:uncharacterized protein (DUF58 family)
MVAFVLTAAVNSQSNLLFFAFGLTAGALLLSFWFSGIVLRKLTLHRLESPTVSAGQPAALEYQLTNRRNHWAGFSLWISEARFSGPLAAPPQGFCPHLPARHTRTVRSGFTPLRRGVVVLRTVEVTSAFPFGFIRRKAQFNLPQEVLVLPRVGRLQRALKLRGRDVFDSGALANRLRGGPEEFFGMREYRQGDSVRLIHWGRSARTGELIVREMTAHTPPQLVVLLDLTSGSASTPASTHAGPAEDVERAIEVAASAACHGLSQGYAVGLVVIGAAPHPALARPALVGERRRLILETLARVDVSTLDPDARVEIPLAVRRRAHWVVVTLGQSDKLFGVVPRQSTPIVLAMNDPASHDWLSFDDAVTTKTKET